MSEGGRLQRRARSRVLTDRYALAVAVAGTMLVGCSDLFGPPLPDGAVPLMPVPV